MPFIEGHHSQNSHRKDHLLESIFSQNFTCWCYAPDFGIIGVIHCFQ
jgi:hypothetical protein